VKCLQDLSCVAVYILPICCSALTHTNSAFVNVCQILLPLRQMPIACRHSLSTLVVGVADLWVQPMSWIAGDTRSRPGQ
jgi:hypothetical protein